MKNKIFLVFIIIVFAGLNFLYGQEVNKNKNELNKTTTVSHYTHFNINNISTFIYNNGISDNSPSGNSGLIYPKGTGKTAVFSSGLLWGGKVDGEVRVGGTAYRTGLKPGKILTSGLAEDPESETTRVYRVRPDYKTADFTAEINDLEGSQKEIYAQYEKDWNEWPAADGAPYNDVDDNGIYDPLIDIPGVPGADQTLWFVANDLDSNQTKFLYGSTSIGLEIQVTIWGYLRDGSNMINNMFFKKYKVINKSQKEIKDMYFGYWSDVDNGDAGDDVDGCDSSLSLGYTYNFNQTDKTYYPLPPPAVGFTLLQGPVVQGEANDIAIVNGRIVKGKKNLDMTSIGYIHKSSPEPYSEPSQGNYERGTLYMYNFLQGKINDGRFYPIPDYLGGGFTQFPYSGDPVNKTGWIDGTDLPPGDRRIMINSGSFNMAPGDTQEVVVGEIVAGAEQGYTNLTAVSLLKQYTKSIQQVYSASGFINTVPDPPEINSSEYDKSVVISWGDDSQKVNRIERNTNGDYYFEGYNIYQLPTDSSGLDEAVKVVTYDVIDNVANILDYQIDPESGRQYLRVIQSGTDSGVKRFIRIDKDYLKNIPLHNGTKYYFAVTTYNYNPSSLSIPRSNESYLSKVTVIPRSTNPGVRYGADFGDILNYSHTSGSSRGIVQPVVIDPLKLNGHKYKISFNISGADTLWSLTDVTTGIFKYDKQKNQSGDDDYLLADGILVKVINDKTIPNSPADEFVFDSPETTFSNETAKADVEKINVFPNPYYGNNPNEETSYGKFITFSHLPQKATIRIFDLAGRLINTLNKDNSDQFLRYQLITQAHTPLASGIYIAYIEMPELDVTKILKFAVVQPQVVPDHY